MTESAYLRYLSKAFEMVQNNHVYPKSGEMEMRRYSALPKQPFWTHLMNTHNYLVIWGEKDYEILIAAILHDMIEDTDITAYTIADEFTPRIAHLVELVTKREGFTKEDIPEYYAKILTDEGACKIKVMDRVDNLITYSMYHKYSERILNKIKETEKYYPEIAGKVGMEEQLESALELVRLRI